MNMNPCQWFSVSFLAVTMMATSTFMTCNPPKGNEISLFPDNTLTSGSNYYAETTAAVIGPGKNENCLKGRIFVSSGGSIHPTVLWQDLSDVPKQGGGQAIPASKFTVTDGQLLSDDNILVRLTNGDLLLIWQAGTWASLDSKPDWWDFMNNPAGDLDPAKNPNNMHAGERSAYYCWKSSDCGQTWEVMPTLDSAKVFNGDCAWPQEANGGPWIGGWDRPDVYVDPWTGKVYLTTMCRSGTALAFPTGGGPKTQLAFPGKGRTDAVLAVLDPNKSDPKWESLFFFGDHGGNNFMPIANTSTQNGRSFCFQCQNGIKPVLFWFDQSSPGKVNKLDLSRDDNGNPTSFWCNSVDSATHTQIKFLSPSDIPGQQVNAWGITLTRGESSSKEDQVRLAYNAFEEGRQVQKIVTVTIKRNVAHPKRSDNTIKVKLIRTITAQEANGSVLQFAFIDPDPKEFNKSVSTALAYWIESDTSNGMLRARMSLLRAKNDWTDLDLSLKPISWTPKIRAGNWAGDYIKGAFYADGNILNFVTQWTESDAAIASPNMNVHYAVVKAAP